MAQHKQAEIYYSRTVNTTPPSPHHFSGQLSVAIQTMEEECSSPVNWSKIWNLGGSKKISTTWSELVGEGKEMSTNSYIRMFLAERATKNAQYTPWYVPSYYMIFTYYMKSFALTLKNQKAMSLWILGCHKPVIPVVTFLIPLAWGRSNLNPWISWNMVHNGQHI